MKSSMNKDDIYVGVGATICYWTDRSPATVISVMSGGKRLLIQEDKYTRTDNNGISDCQSYIYERDPNGAIYAVTLRKDGKYKISKENTLVYIGARERYWDPCF